ncbi:MAG: DUF362 domain-containing protein [Prolixibacteraceae bacterium]|nr:DUF362 domain-containing protein [Prolixibacteraceae bacterium]
MDKKIPGNSSNKAGNTVKMKNLFSRITFLFIGIISTIWFLIRVIPKPSRATYPCMKAAAPFMSGFVVYLLAITGSAFAYQKFKKKLSGAKYFAAFSFLIVAFVMLIIANTSNRNEARAIELVTSDYFVANEPIGEAKGLKPGRVVWMWDDNATDESCDPSAGDWWAEFTDAGVVDDMLKKAIIKYTDISSLPLAWDALFKYFNNEHGKGNVGYQTGEKIYIKINVTNSCCSVSGTKKVNDFNRMDSTPEVLLALLRQLVEYVGVPQENIYLGDPFRTFHDLYWDMLHGEYPNVTYCDGNGRNGRHQTVPSSSHEMFFSDGRLEYRIPQEYIDSDYFINVPCLKTHDSGGMTLGAKNHQGSILQDGAGSGSQSAYDMHYALPDHDGSDGGHYRYRHLVDYLGHEQLGGKTLLTIIDGIWAGRSWEGFVEKWNMAPFNGDYPSSIFVSQDLLAIDAVCYDFLLEEYKNKPNKTKYAYMAGTDDYLFQAADPANWAPGVEYDPEGDGTLLKSLGVYEHWNNATEKKYTRNLGTGNGIELIAISKNDPVASPDLETYRNAFEVSLFPNPASTELSLMLNLNEPSLVSARVCNSLGQKVLQIKERALGSGKNLLKWDVASIEPGFYIINIDVNINGNIRSSSLKFYIER